MSLEKAQLNELLAKNPLGSELTLAEVKENFEFLEDWEDRYGYIIELGRKSPAIPEVARTEANQIFGCQSQVWYLATRDEQSDILRVLIDSDAHIVKGLAAIVMLATNEQKAKQVADADLHAVFDELGLLNHLSPTRGNGLRAMIGTIQTIARN
ncbi:MAG: Fe-S metabolism protein SufE [unclassified Hahellaceae]|nr:Fe-S metabolism protein SufE [Hahellaceae bacterium]|tara:strand:+ start:1847 stop:2308 length:462 start_codon:yes stop_codon:yes gene_type:complete